MKAEKTVRGFVVVTHAKYPPDGTETRLAQESSVVGDYDDAFDRPGSSALWIGDNHHLNREEVAELILRLNHWLSKGRLAVDTANKKIGRKQERKDT
jgi:hypothetical protein